MKTLTNRSGKRSRFLRSWFSRGPAAAPVLTGIGAPARVAPRGKKILIVDDDAVIRRTTTLKLEANGYSVCTAVDGPQALSAVRHERPDLILMDITFPPDVGAVTWDGFLAIAWLRRLEQGRDVPIIVITGTASERMRARAMAAGAVGFFAKPLDHIQILALIERTLGAPVAKAEPGFDTSFEI